MFVQIRAMRSRFATIEAPGVHLCDWGQNGAKVDEIPPFAQPATLERRLVSIECRLHVDELTIRCRLTPLKGKTSEGEAKHVDSMRLSVDCSRLGGTP